MMLNLTDSKDYVTDPKYSPKTQIGPTRFLQRTDKALKA